MESLGQKLRQAREEHNYSIEQVARDTHISKQYLKALEDEDFSVIPGETYIIGFLRNYAEYLYLNPEEIINLYKNIKIQEQPLPMNELLESNNSRSPAFILFISLICVIVLGGGGFLFYRFVISKNRPVEASVSSEETASATKETGYIFQEEALTRWFNLKDSINVPINGNFYPIMIRDIQDKVTLKIPGGTIELNIGQERLLDLNSDFKNDIRVLLNDLDISSTTKRVNIGLYKITRGTEIAVSEGSSGTTEGTTGTAEETSEGSSGTTEGTTGTAEGTTGTAETAFVSVQGMPVKIISAESPSTFRVSISFRGYCLFRYQLSGEDREERFFHKGESFSLDVKKSVRLWISNAGALRVMVAGRDVEIGKPGEVATRVIRWSKNEESGKSILEIIPNS